jgi:ubiquinone/menaquinone biosynthesis C-methylase UbiE
MNREHNEILASDGWRDMLERYIAPFTFGERSCADLGDDVLEVGPGPGLTTDLLRAQVPRLTAIEIESEPARKLAERLAGTNVTVVSHDATAMPFEDARFSGAVMFTMFHHVPTPELQDRLLGEIARVLRPHGVLIASDSVASDDLRALHDGDTYNPADPESLQTRLEGVGFGDVEIRSNDFAWACYARKPR